MSDHFYKMSGHLMHNTDYLKEKTFDIPSEKSRDLFIEWISKRADLLDKENQLKVALNLDLSDRTAEQNLFLKKYEVPYVAGDIILVDLGYNIGHEYGGNHFCVVMKKNSKFNKNVLVLPLTSAIPSGFENQQQHFSLGVLPYLNTRRGESPKTSFVKLSCLIQVSKFRIKNNLKVKGKLSDQIFKELQLNLIDFLSPYHKDQRNQLERTVVKKESLITKIKEREFALKEENKDLKTQLDALKSRIKELEEED